MAKAAKAATSAGHGQRATEATTPTRIVANPSQSAKRPGRSASIANSTSASENQIQETSEPFCMGSHPALEFAHRKLVKKLHAGLAIIEAWNRREVLSAVALENARIFDADFL